MPPSWVYSQSALPIPPVIGWEAFLKNSESLMKSAPVRVTAFAFTGAGALTLAQQGQTGQLIDSEGKVLAEKLLEKKYEYLFNPLVEKPALNPQLI